MKKPLQNSLAGEGLSGYGTTTQVKSGKNMARVKKPRIPKLTQEVTPPLLPKKIKKSTTNYQYKTMEGFMRSRSRIPKLV